MAVNKFRKEELLSLFEMHLARVEMLPKQQKAFVKLFLSSGEYSSIAKMAQLNAATVARRLKKIAHRISSDNFTFALTVNSDLTDKEMEIFRSYFVNGISVKAISENTRLSLYKVKKIIKKYLKN